MLDKDFIEKQKKQLLEKKKELEESLKEFDDKKHDFGTDEDDAVHETEYYTDNVQIHAVLEKQLKDVIDALKKVDQGKYGICEKTGKVIDKARLNAVPEARFCEGLCED